MDAAEAVSLFKGAQALSQTLTGAAAQQQALFSKDAEQAQAHFIEQIDPKAKGKYAGAVNGQDAFKAKSGVRDLDAGQPVERFGSSVVLMDSAASINWATPASTVIYAGQQLHWSTQSDLHMAAAHTVSSVAANAANLFTHSGGIQAIAGNGPVSLQAHTDQLEILADQAVTVISVNDSIEIKAKEKIVLQAGQSSITLEGGNITFACPGKFTVKGGQHLFDGGASGKASFNGLSNSKVNFAPFPSAYSQQVNVGELLLSDPELIGAHYEIWSKGNEGRLLARGTISSEALSERVYTETPEEIEIIVGDNEWGSYAHGDDLVEDDA
jgi:type VI secretion system secreted protein VgrG